MPNPERSGYEKQPGRTKDGGDSPGAAGSASHRKSLRLDQIVQGSQETKQFLEVPPDPNRPSSSQSRISKASSAFSSTSELSRVLGALSIGSDVSRSESPHNIDASQPREGELQLDFPKATIGSGDRSPNEPPSRQSDISRELSGLSSRSDAPQNRSQHDEGTSELQENEQFVFPRAMVGPGDQSPNEPPSRQSDISRILSGLSSESGASRSESPHDKGTSQLQESGQPLSFPNPGEVPIAEAAARLQEQRRQEKLRRIFKPTAGQ